MKDAFLRACRGEKADYAPVWIMRQAGRYLPEYRKIREKVDFLTLCKTPELAAEVTMQPVNILKVDAAILFSDILIPIEAMGMKLEFSESKGPILYNPICDEISLLRLKSLNPEEDVPFVTDTIKMLQRELKVPLIGFSGAPFTLATYMIEGGSTKNFIKSKTMMYQNPALFCRLMEKLTEAVISYLLAQIDAGVDAVQVFDSWVGSLSPLDFDIFALPYVQKIIAAVKNRVPVIYFAFNGSAMLSRVKLSGADVVGLDWRIEAEDAVKVLGHDCSIQGNLDPCILFGSRELIKERAAKILKSGQKARGHIFNLGHGILPETPVDNAKAVVEAVHEISLKEG
ncbi:MAG TPA: uroporphyrinogen decarboxylase [Dissulfurispiraceae bacterium]|nr:uroporphyrinogen decarboxylase [Dissulfurispiraceae bacterium]